MKEVHASHGVAGLFKGVIPRVFLGMWQTLFMVTGVFKELCFSRLPIPARCKISQGLPELIDDFE
jgi:hypothetical protein